MGNGQGASTTAADLALMVLLLQLLATQQAIVGRLGCLENNKATQPQPQ